MVQDRKCKEKLDVYRMIPVSESESPVTSKIIPCFDSQGICP
jgi:hypothetical protein